MKRLIFVASSQHSGSTLLDMLLSAHPDIVGLGETWMLLNDRTRWKYIKHDGSICSCGEHILRCEFWGDMIDYLESTPDTDFVERYKYMLNLARTKWEKGVIVSDSSKYIWALRPLWQAIKGGGLKSLDLDYSDFIVLNLIRDVRGVVSSIKRLDSIPGWRIDQIAAQFHYWFKNHNDMDSYLHRSDITNLRVSYEGLCFSRSLIEKKIFQVVGIDSDNEFPLGRSINHIGVGNPARNHEIKSRTVRYDPRWFEEGMVQILYLMMAQIRRYNRKAVYEGQFLTGTSYSHFEPLGR